jgi:hypothetical protein
LRSDEIRQFNIEILNWPGPLWKGDREEWRALQRWTNSGYNTHMHGNNTRSLPHSYLLSQTSKNSMFLFLGFFSSTKLENRRIEQVLSKRWGAWHRWEGGGGRQRGSWMNLVQIMYIHVCKCKNDTGWNCSRNWGWGMKESSGGGEFNMIYLIHCKNLCKCYSVPSPNTIIIKN